MIEFEFYNYYEENDNIIIYCEMLHDYFRSNYNIIVDSVDFDKNFNVILYIEDSKLVDSAIIEKKLLETIKHLNDVEVRNMKIVLTFDCEKIELH